MKRAYQAGLLGLLISTGAVGTLTPAEAQIVRIDRELPVIVFPSFTERVAKHLAASSENFAVINVTIHTTGWINNPFTAFGQLELRGVPTGEVEFVFSDREYCGPHSVPATSTSFGSCDRVKFDPDQPALGAFSINAITGAIDLGFLGLQLIDYESNPSGTLVTGFTNGSQNYVAVVSAKLGSRHIG
jgi:hypothetical protein